MRSNRWSRLGWGIALAVLALSLAFPVASAQQPGSKIRDKFRTGDTVVIAAGETVPHDLYVAGGTVRIDGRIDGDLFVGCGTVDITGPVTGDVFVGGGTVNVSGEVGRHLRVGAGNLTVNGPVKLDVLAGAGTAALGSAAKVGGDLIFSAGQMSMGGAVAGGVLGSTGVYGKTGSVTGAEDVTINEPRPESARPAPSAASRVLDEVRRYVGIMIVGALLLWLPPRVIQLGATRLRERPLPSLGYGAMGLVGFFAVLLGLFIGMLMLAIPLGILGLVPVVLTVVFGALLGSALLTFLFTVVLLFVAAAVVGLTLGQFALERLDVSRPRNPYVALLVGVLVVVLLTAIPVVGGLVSAVVALLGLGALLLGLWPTRGASVAVTPPAPTVAEA